jgi:hypothetical protein
MSSKKAHTNAADPRQVWIAEKLEERRLSRWVSSLGAVMGDPNGRAFVWAVIRRAGVYESPFDPHGSVQSHKIGRGDMGREILAEVLRHYPAEYLLMEKEAREVEALERAQIEASRTRRGDSTEAEE